MEVDYQLIVEKFFLREVKSSGHVAVYTLSTYYTCVNALGGLSWDAEGLESVAALEVV